MFYIVVKNASFCLHCLIDLSGNSVQKFKSLFVSESQVWLSETSTVTISFLYLLPSVFKTILKLLHNWKTLKIYSICVLKHNFEAIQFQICMIFNEEFKWSTISFKYTYQTSYTTSNSIRKENWIQYQIAIVHTLSNQLIA